MTSINPASAPLQDLLLELGCEDLPARYVMPLANSLAVGITGGLTRRGVSLGGHAIYATPRRIAVLVSAVATQQPEQAIERSGPALAAAYKDGKPTPAALGFAKSCGVEFSEIGDKDGKLFYKKMQPGKPTTALIPEIFEDTLKSMDELVPKRMRWGAGEETFVRPVSWLVCLLGTEVVPLARFGVHSGRLTYGHRFHAPEAISLAAPADYAPALKAAKVWADVASRKAEIRRQIEAKAAVLGGHARITEDLLDEVTALVEWPVVIAGQMEKRFTDELPREVIVATVETNQRYFTVFADAALTTITPHFITIANIESRDVAQVIEGNERVVRPRLSDAMFFWEQDKKQPLAAYREKLVAATYQKDLGSVGAKVERICMLAGHLAAIVGANPSVVAAAASLCKNDLNTKMVYEFPELQGIMGGYYAGKSGESAEVSLAIREHYLPTQQGTHIPSTKAGQIVALADKLDTLAGIFAIGQKPTASRDPFALRRAALGILRICIEGQLRIDLTAVVNEAVGLAYSKISGSEISRSGPVMRALGPDVNESARSVVAGFEARKNETANDVQLFLWERLRGYYESLPAEMFEAVKTLGISSPLDFDARIQALRSFWALPEAKNLAAAHKRVRNILKQAGGAGGAVNVALFEHASEAALHERMLALPSGGSYTERLTALATLREPVDAFFTDVMVNADNPAVRANRLALLSQLDVMCREVADISLLPG